MTVDDRAYLMHLIPSLKTEDALILLYPTIFPISDLILEQQAAEVFSLFFKSLLLYVIGRFDNG